MMTLGLIHNKESIISEHYGFSEALIEKMQDSNEDCHDHVEPPELPISEEDINGRYRQAEFHDRSHHAG